MYLVKSNRYETIDSFRFGGLTSFDDSKLGVLSKEEDSLPEHALPDEAEGQTDCQ